jgi:DNA-binding transcriptional LysR family regulator
MPKGMELDLRQVRAFAAVVEHAHFGRAARSLFLTQQALSKRIARLESQVGTLFDRQSSGPTLTPRGRRFLPAARRLLEAADHALDEREATLRVDVWGPVDPPESMLRAYAAEHPEMVIELGMRRNFGAALDAVRRNELDAAIGNVANLPEAVEGELATALIATTPLSGLVDDAGELSSADVITETELRNHGLALPPQSSQQEFGRFISEFASAVDAPLSRATRPFDLDHLVDRVAAGTSAVTLVPSALKARPGTGVRIAPLRPTPLFPWFLVWRAASPDPLLHRMVRSLTGHETAQPVDAGDSWLPAGVVQRDGASVAAAAGIE